MANPAYCQAIANQPSAMPGCALGTMVTIAQQILDAFPASATQSSHVPARNRRPSNARRQSNASPIIAPMADVKPQVLEGNASYLETARIKAIAKPI